MTLPIVKWRHSQRRPGSRLRPLSAWYTADLRDQHARGIPLWRPSASETADDLSLALALLCASCNLLLGARISSDPSQTDHLQSARLVSGLPPRLRRWRTTPLQRRLPRATLRTDSGEEGSLLNLLGLSPATLSSVAVWSVPMPAKESSSGATCPTSRSRCASSSAISLLREPPNGEPPNGARSRLPPTPHEDHLRGGSVQPPRGVLWCRVRANDGAVPPGLLPASSGAG